MRGRPGVGRWLFHTPDGVMQRTDYDPRPGGALTIVERRGDDLANHFGRFVEIEPLNPAFRPRQAKMRVTVDTERRPRLPESDVLSELYGTRVEVLRSNGRILVAGRPDSSHHTDSPEELIL